jgi:hypothetical protein
MTTPAPHPEQIDLDALHAAYLAEGYTLTGDNGTYRIYSAVVHPVGLQYVSVPLAAAYGNGTDARTRAEADALRALNWLIGATGNQYLECGPRNEREAAYAAALNRAHSTAH